MLKTCTLIFALLLAIITNAADKTKTTVPAEAAKEEFITITSGENTFRLAYDSVDKNKALLKSELNNKRALRFKKFSFDKKTNDFSLDVLKNYEKGVVVKEQPFYTYDQLLTLFDVEYMAKEKNSRYRIGEKELTQDEFESALQNLAGSNFKELPKVPQKKLPPKNSGR